MQTRVQFLANCAKVALTREAFIAAAGDKSVTVIFINDNNPITGLATFTAADLYDLIPAVPVQDNYSTAQINAMPFPTSYTAQYLEELAGKLFPTASLSFSDTAQGESYAAARSDFFQKWANVKLHIECHVARQWDDIEGVEYGGHTKAKVYDATDIWTAIVDAVNPFSGELPTFSTRSELVAYLDETLNDAGEGECSYTVWKSAKAYRQHIEEKTRQRLEQTAARLAASLKVPQGPGSLQFIRAARKFLKQSNRRQQAYREGLREDGLCASGGSVDAWYEMANDSRSAQYRVAEEVQEALAWVKQNCPLLWASYRESVLAKRKAKA